MKKRVFILAILVLILASSVLAAHTANVFINPDSIYETNNVPFNLWVQNDIGSSNFIINVTLSHSGVTTTAVQNPEPWLNDGDINWYGGTIPRGWPGLFIFNATANLVNSDTLYTWTVTTTDSTGFTNTTTVNVNILNDTIPPNITYISPEDYSFIRNETINPLNFYISAQELETSLPNKIYMGYRDSNTMVTSGVVASYLELTDLGGGTYSVSWLPDQALKQFIDYRVINLTDAAGNAYDEGNNLPHHLYIDKEYPVVALNQPENNLITNQYIHNITFNTSDNSFETIGQGLFRPEVNCTIYLGPISYGPQSYYNNINDASFLVDLTGLVDGVYPYIIWCSDKTYYYTGSDSKIIILDTTGPVIILDSPLNESIISNTNTIKLLINDQFSTINSVWYSLNGATNTTIFAYDIPTLTWPEGLNTLIVYANDSLGNLAQNTFEFTVDATPPSLNINFPLVSPYTSNSQITFLYTATDALSGINNCQLYIDDFSGTGPQLNQTTISTTSITTTLTEGSYAYSITCFDNVGLSASLVPALLNIDTTPPSPALIDLVFLNLDNTNDDDGNINIDYTISDPSGISSCNLFVDGIFNQTTTPPLLNFTISVESRNNPYNIYISCNDTVNNLYTSSAIDVYYDKTPPTISSIQELISSLSATINWNTDEFSNSRIDYSTDQLNLNLSATDPNNVTQHTLQLITLTSSTTYYYQIFSADKWNNIANTTISSFTTNATPSSPGPSGGGGGGGGGGTAGGGEANITCTEFDYECSAWSECQQPGVGNIGSQSRTCNLKEGINCEPGYVPLSLRNCELPLRTITETPEGRGLLGTPLPTGAAIIDGLTSTPATAIMISLLILLIIAAIYRWLNKSPPKKIDISKIKNLEEIERESFEIKK